MIHVDLHPGCTGRRYAVLRPLTGVEELTFAAGEAFAGTALIDKLLVPAAGACVGPGQADALPVADRDRLIAALYKACFGERIESVCRCGACGERFEFNFLIDEIASRAADGRAAEGPDADGYFALESGGRFRLPTVTDLKAIAGFDRDTALARLRERCTQDATGHDDIDAAMERAGPLLSCDLDARCPNCSNGETVRFDIEHYFLTALAVERRYLTREIHILASAYHWPLSEIVSLPREDRRALVRCVKAGQRAGVLG